MDILDEEDLDGVSFEELLEIHVGVHHPLENSDDSEEDTSYSKLPVFDLQQIKASAVNAKDLHTGSQSPLQSVENCLGPDDAQFEQIAKSLSGLIGFTYCCVCFRHITKRGNHYHSNNHFTNVIFWIESRTRTTDPNVTKKIFCAPCNLALVRKSEQHYSTKTHVKNERRFCTLCLEVVTKPMKHHIYQHCVQNAQSQGLDSTTRDSFSCNTEIVARELKAKLTSSICHVCKMTVNKSLKHYKKKRHLKNMRNWIDDNSYRIGIYITNDQSSFYCEACNEIFACADLSRQHYETMEHLKSLCAYCNICRKHLANRESLRSHFRKKHNIVVSKPKATGQNLEELTRLDMCQLCTLSFKEATDAQTHYHQTSLHAIRVFDFLEMNEAKFCGNSINGHNVVSKHSTCNEPNDHLTEPFEENDDVGSTEGFQDNDNKKSEFSRIESDIHLTEESNDNEFEHLDSILKEQIVNEISLVIDKTYYSKSVSLKAVLEGLKSLNRQVAGIIESNKTLPNTEESSKRYDQNLIKVDHRLTQVLSKNKSYSSIFTKPLINSANQDYAKLKLVREISKMKATLEKFSVEVALRFLHGFRISVMNVGKNNFDVEFAFSFPEIAAIYVPSVASNLLKIELEVVERKLAKSKRISMEFALEIVSQFNIRLEKEAERMERGEKTLVYEDQECFKNTEEHIAGALSTLKSLGDDSVNAKKPHIEKPISTNQDYAKLQLRTEITRTKTVLTAFLVADALKYVQGFKMLIKNIHDKQENTFDKVDVGVVFLSTEVFVEDAARDLVLQRELAGLEWMLTVGRKSFEVELALDIVKQFNVGLERLIDFQKGDNAGGNSILTI